MKISRKLWSIIIEILMVMLCGTCAGLSITTSSIIIWTINAIIWAINLTISLADYMHNREHD